MCALGQPLLQFDVLDSTNSYCKRCAVRLPHGAVVMSRSQTAGRGRAGRAWTSPDAGLMFSVLLKGSLPAPPQTLPLRCALGVREALAPYAECRIKWPNDLIVDGKKLVGILCESGTCGAEAYAVCGVGINLDFGRAALPVPYATDLRALTGRAPDRMALARAVFPALERAFAADWAALLPVYRAACVNLGRPVRLADGREGVAEDLDDTGRLLVRCRDELVAVGAGECQVQGVYALGSGDCGGASEGASVSSGL